MEKKKVSFNNIQTEHEPTATTEVEVEEKKIEATLELNALMTKFKKINTNDNTSKSSIQNQNGQLIQMSEDIAFIKKNMIELTEKINKLMNVK